MAEPVYTLGVWRVKPGNEDAFVSAWKALGLLFGQLPRPPAGKGLLLQSTADETLFYSMGPWHSQDDIQAMRADPAAQAGLLQLRELCTEGVPGSFRLAAVADVPDASAQT